jgi:hypothetical protein
MPSSGYRYSDHEIHDVRHSKRWHHPYDKYLKTCFFPSAVAPAKLTTCFQHFKGWRDPPASRGPACLILPPLPPPTNLDQSPTRNITMIHTARRPMRNTMVPEQPTQPLYMRQHPTALPFYYPAPVGLQATSYNMPMFAPSNYWPLVPIPRQLCAPYQAYLSTDHKRQVNHPMHTTASAPK